MEDRTIVTIVGLLSLIVSVVFVGLIWLIKEQFKQSNTTLEDGTKSINLFVVLISGGTGFDYEYPVVSVVPLPSSA